MVACLDEIVITQRRRPALTGVLLGLLLTVQFFLSTELLVIIAMAGAFGLVLVTAYAAWRRPRPCASMPASPSSVWRRRHSW